AGHVNRHGLAARGGEERVAQRAHLLYAIDERARRPLALARAHLYAVAAQAADDVRAARPLCRYHTQQLLAQPAQIARNGRIELARRHHLARHAVDRQLGRAAIVWRDASERLVQDHAEAVPVT